MRALPATITPFPGETVRSIYRRLVEKNDLTTGELWTAIRKQISGLPLRTTPELVPRTVEEIAGLPHGYVDRDLNTHRLFIRCEHTGWQHSNCPACAPSPAPVTMCRHCTGGAIVEARTRGGAVCTRHRRWHFDGRDDHLPDARYLRAERCLTGTLWQRGIGLNTGEIELAADLLTAHQEHHAHTELSAPRVERLRGVYPDAVRVTAFLTEPWATRFLATPGVGHLPVVALIEASVAAMAEGSRSDLETIREAFRTNGRETYVRIERAARVRHGRPLALGELGTRVRGSAPRLRTTFLRHNDARHSSSPLPSAC